MDKRCVSRWPDDVGKLQVCLSCSDSSLTGLVCNRYKEGDMNVGENSCVDRCASKYWQVTGIVGQLIGGAPQ